MFWGQKYVFFYFFEVKNGDFQLQYIKIKFSLTSNSNLIIIRLNYFFV